MHKFTFSQDLVRVLMKISNLRLKKKMCLRNCLLNKISKLVHFWVKSKNLCHTTKKVPNKLHALTLSKPCMARVKFEFQLDGTLQKRSFLHGTECSDICTLCTPRVHP